MCWATGPAAKEKSDDDQADPHRVLPVAAAGSDGRAPALRHHRTGPAAGATRHRAVRLPGPPAGHQHPGTALAAGAVRVVRHLRGGSGRVHRPRRGRPGCPCRRVRGPPRQPAGRPHRPATETGADPARRVTDQCWRRIDTDTGPVLIIEYDEPDTELPKTDAPEPSSPATRSPSTRSPATEMESCARCRRAFRPAGAGRSSTPDATPGLAIMRRWPDGPICSGCFAKAVETYGHCQACRTHRLLPGVGPAGQRWCTDCAGGLGNFTCARCGREGWIERVGTCGSCVLTDRIRELLDDGTGRVRPELQPLADRITAMSRPRSGILWLSRPAPQGILRALAAGRVPLTHDGLSGLTPRRSVIYIRDLMIAAGILPPVDRFLLLFEQWWPTWLAGLNDPDHRKVLRH